MTLRFYTTLRVSPTTQEASTVEVEILAESMEEALAVVGALSLGYRLAAGEAASISPAYIGTRAQRAHRYAQLTYKGLLEGLKK